MSGVSFTQTTAGTHQGNLAYTVTGFEGTLRIRIDANNNGVFTDPVDRVQRVYVTPGAKTYAFNGLDGQGNAIPLSQTVNYQILIDRVGEIHFMNVDVENRSGGIEIQRLNGPLTGRTTLYWNDTFLDTNRCTTTSPYNGTAGIDSNGGVHAWGFTASCQQNDPIPANRPWGDMRVIEEWSYVPVNVVAGMQFPANPAIDTVKSVANVSQQGSDAKSFNVPYTVQVKNTGDVINSNVQLNENLRLTFTDGNPTLTISAPLTVLSGPCTANTSFNGVSDTRLLTGTDDHNPGDTCVLGFTVNVTYANISDIPTDAQDNTVFASAISTAGPNPGYTFTGGTPVEPAGVTVTDLSTDSPTLPTGPNADTPTPTPVRFPRPELNSNADTGTLSRTGVSLFVVMGGSIAVVAVGGGLIARRYF